MPLAVPAFSLDLKSRYMPLDQGNLPEHSESHAGAPLGIPGASRLSGKLLLVASTVGVIALVFLLLFSATHLRAIRSAWAGLVDKPQSISAEPPVRRAFIAAPITSQSRSLSAPSPIKVFSPEEQAQKIWADFEKANLGTAVDNWSKQHPEILCRRYNGTTWSTTADAQWAERCSAGEQQEDAHWSFYAFGLEEPIVSRLEQFDVSTASLPSDSLTAVHALLQSRLGGRFGSGEDTSPKIGRTRDSVWPPNLRWQRPDLEIQLFQSELDPRTNQGRLRLQARSRVLLDALKEDERLKQFGTSNYIYEAGSAIDAQLSEKLKSEFPGLDAMLMKQRPDTYPQKVKEALEQWKQQFRQSQSAGQTGVRAAVIAIPQSDWKASEFEEAIVALLTAAKTASSERQPMLLMAADRLAGRLPFVMTNDKSQADHWEEWRRQLEKLGVTYDGSGASLDGYAWTYTGSFLNRVWSNYAQNEWENARSCCFLPRASIQGRIV